MIMKTGIQIVSDVNTTSVYQQLSHPDSGGICVFIENVRNITQNDKVILHHTHRRKEIENPVVMVEPGLKNVFLFGKRNSSPTRPYGSLLIHRKCFCVQA